MYVPLSLLPPPVLPTAAAAPFVRGLLNYGAAFLLPRGSEIGSGIGEREKKEKKRSILGMLKNRHSKGGKSKLQHHSRRFRTALYHIRINIRYHLSSPIHFSSSSLTTLFLDSALANALHHISKWPRGIFPFLGGGGERKKTHHRLPFPLLPSSAAAVRS